MAGFLPHFAILSFLTLKLCLDVATSPRQNPPSYSFILWLQHDVAGITSFPIWMLLMLPQERGCDLCFMQILRHCSFLLSHQWWTCPQASIGWVSSQTRCSPPWKWIPAGLPWSKPCPLCHPVTKDSSWLTLLLRSCYTCILRPWQPAIKIKKCCLLVFWNNVWQCRCSYTSRFENPCLEHLGQS